MRILAIGNSFSDDSFEFLYEIIKSSGFKDDLYLGNLYYGGCSLQQHNDFYDQKSTVYEYRTNCGDGWKTKMESTIFDALLDGEWDIITFQQRSGLSGKSESYDFLHPLMEKVRAHVGSKPKFMWHMTWAYAKNSTHPDFAMYDTNQEIMYNSILNAVREKILPLDEIVKVCPCGKAIQQARETELRVYGEDLTRDGYHLNFKIGRYLSGLTLAKSLLGIDVFKVDFMPDEVDCNMAKLAKEIANLVADSKI